MNAPQNRAQFARALPTVAELEARAEQARAGAVRPEPLWLSIVLTLGVALAVVLLVMI